MDKIKQLDLAKCSSCKNMHIVLWAHDAQTLCDRCFNSIVPGDRGVLFDFKLYFYPRRQTSGGGWISDPAISFSILREFIESCMRPQNATIPSELLVSTSRSLDRLIKLLESKVSQVELDSVPFRFSEESRRLEESKKNLNDKLEILGFRQRHLEEQLFQGVERANSGNQIKELELEKKQAAILRSQISDIDMHLAKIVTNRSAYLEADILAVRLKSAKRVRQDYERWRKGELIEFHIKDPIRRVYWELLKNTGDSWSQIVQHFENLQRLRNERYDLQRIKQIYDLKPELLYIGSASFEGYIVFLLQQNTAAVLECPKVGNAIYVMDSENWKFLSQLSKTELLERDDVIRIVHDFGWFRELQSLLTKYRKT